MFPLKDNMMDYMAEINRLFPKTNENDVQPTSIFNSNYSQSPIHSTFANRSSSSADSTSPEYYPDLFTSFQQTSDLYNLRLSETPLQSSHPLGIRPQRPIVGRKILGNAEYSKPLTNRNINNDCLISNTWIEDFTLPKSTLFEQNQVRNYELFPSDKSSPTTSFMAPTPNLSPMISNSPIESYFSTATYSPNKSKLTTTTYSPIESNLSTVTYSPMKFDYSTVNFSPVESNLPTASCSPMKSNLSTANFTPNESNLSTAAYSPMKSNLSTASNFSPNKSRLDSCASNFSLSPSILDLTPSSMSIPNYTPSYPAPLMSDFTQGISEAGTSRIDEIGAQKMCKFCRRNGETPLVYMTHCVKEKVGKKHIVTCPILRSHVCSACGGTGDFAHTITYCPLLRSSNNGKRLESTTITLKNTRIKSNGKRRY